VTWIETGHLLAGAKKVQNGFPKSVGLVLLLYFFSRLILDIKHVHNPVPKGRNSCEVDVAPVIRQCLGRFIEDTQSILSRNLDDSIKAGVLIINLHFSRDPGDDLLPDPV